MKNIHFTAIDFETAQPGRAACQLGIVVVRQGEIVEQKKYLIQPPQNEYSQNCINKHGITAKDTEHAPTFDMIWDEVKPYLERQTVVCHSKSCDINVIEKECAYYNITPCKYLSVVCTSEIHGKASLEDVCASYNIPLDNHHDALADAYACAQILLKYLMLEETITINRTHGKNDSNKRCTKAELEEYKRRSKSSKDYSIKNLANADKGNPFYDKTVKITGDFPIPRGEMELVVYNMGTAIKNSLSSKVEIALVGDNATQKKLDEIESYKEKGSLIKVYHIDEVMELINKYL